MTDTAPSDLRTDLEAALLCSLLERPHLRTEVAGRVEPEDMSSHVGARALELLTTGEEDTLQLLNRAARFDQEVFSALNALWGRRDVQPWRAAHYARSVHEAAVRRSIAHVSECQQAALRGEQTTLPDGTVMWAGLGHAQITSMCADAVHALSRGTVDDSWMTLGEAARAAVDRTERQQGASEALTTGIGGLDDLLDGGLWPGHLTILSGRPGSGKTAFALHLIEMWAEQVAGGAPGAIVSLEMTARELAARKLSSTSGIPGSTLRQGTVTQDDWPILLDARDRLDMWPVQICTLPRLTAAGIRNAARPLHQRGELAWLMVDYLTLLDEPEGARSKSEGVGRNSTELKCLAKEWGIPVLCLAQMNRESTKDKTGRRPVPSDLRDSGQIEQDADDILFLHSPNDAPVDERELIVAKQRAGRTGQVLMRFDAPTMRFTDRGDLL